MYKVFFNDHVLCFCDKNKISPKNNKLQVVEIEGIVDFFNQFPENSFMELSDNLCVVCSDLENAWKGFREEANEIPAAGGILTNSESELLFIKRFGRWDLPKGKIEEGETIEQAAARELEEECGLNNVRIVKSLPSTYHLYFSPYLKPGNNLVLKETFWFEMIYDGNEKPTPQISEGIEEVKWFSKNKLEKIYKSTYKNLVELLDNYLA